MTLTKSQLYGYAADLILNHAQDVEDLTIYEMAGDRLHDVISDDDAKKIASLVGHAIVTVRWKTWPGVIYDNIHETNEDGETETVDE